MGYAGLTGGACLMGYVGLRDNSGCVHYPRPRPARGWPGAPLPRPREERPRAHRVAHRSAPNPPPRPRFRRQTASRGSTQRGDGRRPIPSTSPLRRTAPSAPAHQPPLRREDGAARTTSASASHPGRGATPAPSRRTTPLWRVREHAQSPPSPRRPRPPATDHPPLHHGQGGAPGSSPRASPPQRGAPPAPAGGANPAGFSVHHPFGAPKLRCPRLSLTRGGRKLRSAPQPSPGTVTNPGGARQAGGANEGHSPSAPLTSPGTISGGTRPRGYAPSAISHAAAPGTAVPVRPSILTRLPAPASPAAPPRQPFPAHPPAAGGCGKRRQAAGHARRTPCQCAPTPSSAHTTMKPPSLTSQSDSNPRRRAGRPPLHLAPPSYRSGHRGKPKHDPPPLHRPSQP